MPNNGESAFFYEEMDGSVAGAPCYTRGQESIPVVPQGATYHHTAAPYWDWTVTIPPRHRTGMKIKVSSGCLVIDDFDFTTNEAVKELYHGGYIKRDDVS